MDQQETGMMRPTDVSERELMRTPEEVTTILELKRQGWGVKRIARELGISKNTVKVYLRKGTWVPYGRPARKRMLDGQASWVAESYLQHRGNADVVRQELGRQFGLEVSLRTVERAVRPLRRQLKAAALATVRFETPPGRQLQADFGQTRVSVGGQMVWAHLCVLTLGFSRRVFVEPFPSERRHNWYVALEGAFAHFGGVPQEVLIDNTRVLVRSHDRQTREVTFTDSFRAFCTYWGFRPVACAPFRARTKGKDENGVGYVKHNAIAGRRFDSWEQLAAHLRWWMREVADTRVHGSTGEQPLERFLREERTALQPLRDRPPYVQAREVVRRVQSDLCVEVDTNHYSVPWRYIGEQVFVQFVGAHVTIQHAGGTIADHRVCRGRHQWIVDKRHFQGVASAPAFELEAARVAARRVEPTLLRPLSDYEALVGGA
jgi:transposase